MGIGDWGLGIGDWGLGIGLNPQFPIPNHQFLIPNYGATTAIPIQSTVPITSTYQTQVPSTFTSSTQPQTKYKTHPLRRNYRNHFQIKASTEREQIL